MANTLTVTIIYGICLDSSGLTFTVKPGETAPTLFNYVSDTLEAGYAESLGICWHKSREGACFIGVEIFSMHEIDRNGTADKVLLLDEIKRKEDVDSAFEALAQKFLIGENPKRYVIIS